MILGVAENQGEEKVIIDFFDVVEINHYHNSTTGEEIFTQSIWYKQKKTWVFVSSGNGLEVFKKDTFPLHKPPTIPLFDEYSLRRRWDYGYEIIAWRLVKKNNSPYPILENGVYVQEWEERQIKRKVVCLFFIETWTTFDVEMFSRSLLPKEDRIGLSKP